MGLHQPPTPPPPNFESLPYPEVGGRLEFFSLRGRNPEQFSPFAAHFWAPGWKLFGGGEGLLQLLLGELGLRHQFKTVQEDFEIK